MSDLSHRASPRLYHSHHRRERIYNDRQRTDNFSIYPLFTIHFALSAIPSTICSKIE